MPSASSSDWGNSPAHRNCGLLAAGSSLSSKGQCSPDKPRILAWLCSLSAPYAHPGILGRASTPVPSTGFLSLSSSGSAKGRLKGLWFCSSCHDCTIFSIKPAHTLSQSPTLQRVQHPACQDPPPGTLFDHPSLEAFLGPRAGESWKGLELPIACLGAPAQQRL